MWYKTAFITAGIQLSEETCLIYVNVGLVCVGRGYAFMCRNVGYNSLLSHTYTSAVYALKLLKHTHTQPCEQALHVLTRPPSRGLTHICHSEMRLLAAQCFLNDAAKSVKARPIFHQVKQKNTCTNTCYGRRLVMLK